MQSAFRIKILARKADIIGDGFGENLRFTERKVRRFPDNYACRVHDLLRRTEVVVDNVIHPGLCTVQFQCDEVAVLVDIIPERAAVTGGFGDQAALEVVMEMDGCAGDGFLDPSGEGILSVFRNGHCALLEMGPLHLSASLSNN
jgi:hypothetical protein